VAVTPSEIDTLRGWFAAITAAGNTLHAHSSDEMARAYWRDQRDMIRGRVERLLEDAWHAAAERDRGR
jgi:hypothetical protein